MTYIKEDADKDLLQQWKQETGLNLYGGIHDKWAVDREQKSYLTFRTSDHELPAPGEEMCRYYDFLYQKKLYRLDLYCVPSKDNIMQFKAREIKPKPNLDNGEFSKNLDSAMTTYECTNEKSFEGYHVIVE